VGGPKELCPGSPSRNATCFLESSSLEYKYLAKVLLPALGAPIIIIMPVNEEISRFSQEAGTSILFSSCCRFTPLFSQRMYSNLGKKSISN
jgi:hypothetical protein